MSPLPPNSTYPNMGIQQKSFAKKTSPDVIMADGCKPLNVVNPQSGEALLRSWGVLPGRGSSLPGALPAQPRPQSAAEFSHSGHVALPAMYLRGAAATALGVASKDVVAAGSSANLSKHAAGSKGQSGGSLCQQGCTASGVLKLGQGSLPKTRALQLE